MTNRLDEHNESFNIDEIEDLISNEDEFIPKPSQISSNIAQAQSLSLSLQNSSINAQEKQKQLNQSINQKETNVLTVKTTNIPGPVGLLPILKTTEDIKRLKEDKTARDKILTNEENLNGKRTKPSSDLFSLNIMNYPSYTLAFQQLGEIFHCEPISIETALMKARLGIKKRIPLMCAVVTQYDRQENTILLDKTAHIRATFIGDDELLDSFNIRIGHTLVLRNVAVFTSIRRRHHYVNIHVQNIIAIQDPLLDSLSMPLSSQNYQQEKTLKLIENEIFAYDDSSNCQNETFRIFSQSDNEDDEQRPIKKFQSSNSSGFNHIKSKTVPTISTKKFQETTSNKTSSSTITINQQQQPIDTDLSNEDFNSELFSDW